MLLYQWLQNSMCDRLYDTGGKPRSTIRVGGTRGTHCIYPQGSRLRTGFVLSPILETPEDTSDITSGGLDDGNDRLPVPQGFDFTDMGAFCEQDHDLMEGGRLRREADGTRHDDIVGMGHNMQPVIKCTGTLQECDMFDTVAPEREFVAHGLGSLDTWATPEKVLHDPS